ncbi:hypothetical protein SAMN06309944_0169 [Micrococcales bacterium KH10]|nr:hypothetical protein SAMN06309944_0169 [Micrococcales bacterium KH10]
MTITENPLLGRVKIDVQTPQPGRFVLGQSLINSSTERLASPANATTVTNIIGSAVQSITITRNVGDAGTLNFTLLDADTAGLSPGSWVQVAGMTTSGWGPIFQGTIRGYTQNIEDGHTYTTVAATNCYTELANQTRYGASSGTDTPDTWGERIDRILGSAPDLSTNLLTTGGTTYPAADSVHETSIANWLDIMCASSPTAGWFVSRANVVTVRANKPTGVSWYADPTGVWNPSTLLYTNITHAFDTADVVNEVEVTNHRRELNDQNEWQALDETTTYEDVTSRATWGAGTASADVCIADPADVDLLGPTLLTEPLNAPTSIRVNAQSNITAVTRAELLDRIAFGNDQRRITGITHEITPTRWMVDYELGAI